MRGTVKAATLEGDPQCPSLLAVSIYDTKPVNFLSMAAENNYWVEKERAVFDRTIREIKKLNYIA